MELTFLILAYKYQFINLIRGSMTMNKLLRLKSIINP